MSAIVSSKHFDADRSSFPLAGFHTAQSTLAWLADLVGQYLLDSIGEQSIDFEPSDMEGLVLIDQLDLCLDQIWQSELVRALGSTFPRLQFVATTHSPALLDALPPDAAVELHLDDEGNVRATRPAHAGPRPGSR